MNLPAYPGDLVIKIGAVVATRGPAALLRNSVLTYIRRMTEYSGTAGKVTKEARSGNLRSAPAVWVIKNGKPTLSVPQNDIPISSALDAKA
jgi:hypothetical protein